MSVRFLLLGISLVVFLQGCGQKSALYLPDEANVAAENIQESE